MANPIIQNYLNDTSIPKEKRQFAINQLKEGVPEEKVASGITTKYGDVYIPKPRTLPDGQEMSVSEFYEKQAADPNYKITYTSPIGPMPQQKAAPKTQPKSQSFSDKLKSSLLSAGKSMGKAALTNPIVNPVGFYEANKDRAKSGAEGLWKGLKSGFGDVGAGVEQVKGAANQAQILEDAKNNAEKNLASGKIDKKTYDQVIDYYNKNTTKKVLGNANLGVSNILKGATREVFSPYEGAIGAFKPEMEVATNKISEEFSKMKPETKERLSKYIGKISEAAKDHPAIANYLTSAFEIAGGIGASHAAHKGAEGVVKGLTKGVTGTIKGTTKWADDFANAANSAMKGLPSSLDDITKKAAGAMSKVAKIDLPGSQSRQIKKATELLTPEINAKNLRIAASQGLASEGKKGLFTGAKDVIKLTPRMEKAANTLAKKFPDLTKTSSFALPSKIDNQISKIATPLKTKFQKIEVPDSIKSNLKQAWDKLRASQTKGINYNSGVKNVQNKFDDIFSKIMNNSKRSASGKFRKQNIDDLWDAVKAFDKEVGAPIRDAVELAASDRNLAMQKAWLQTRKILRDAMDNLVANVDDTSVKTAFGEMSDLFTAQSQILKNIKPSNKTGESFVGSLAKNYGKQALGTAVGTGAVYGALN